MKFKDIELSAFWKSKPISYPGKLAISMKSMMSYNSLAHLVTNVSTGYKAILGVVYQEI